MQDSKASPHDSGDIPSEEIRKNASLITGIFTEYLDNIENYPVLPKLNRGDLKAALPEHPPEEGEPLADILKDFEKLILPAATHWNHPNFHGLFATSGSAVGAIADFLSSMLDMKGMLWRTAPASVELEELTLDWLSELLGLEERFKGLIYDTASISTMHALAAARERLGFGIRQSGMAGRSGLPLLRTYASDQVHSSIDKSCITLGLGLDSLKKIPSDEKFVMRADLLNQAIEEDLKSGIQPMAVVATIGTTSTTSVDPVNDIAQICERHKLWLHVDAAYAGPAAMLEEKRHFFSGWERADSIVVNPHKWLMTPFDLSVLYLRRIEALSQAFSLVPEYLKTPDMPQTANPMDYGIQLGRRFRSLKLWFVMRYFGKKGLVSRLRLHCRLAEYFAEEIAKEGDFELMAPVNFALVVFRAKSKDVVNPDEFNLRLLEEINSSGEAFISHTVLGGKVALRLSVGSLHTRKEHIDKIIRIIKDKTGQMLKAT
jgi:aromatic-L-amino-acid decarboxylase